MTSWDAPFWSQSSEWAESAVLHSRRIGSVPDLEGETLVIDLVQWDSVSVSPDLAAVERGPLWIRVGGVRVGLEEARRLAALLAVATGYADHEEYERRRFAA
jgi:hypothetical protein